MATDFRNAALVADGNRFQDIAILIGRERQRMADARIGRIALVVEGNRLARMREEDCITVCPARLKRRDREIALGDGVRPSRKRCAVQSIDLLAQHRALESAASLTRFLRRQVAWQDGVVEQCVVEMLMSCPTFTAARALAIILVLEMSGNATVGDKYPGMEPRLCQDGGTLKASLMLSPVGKSPGAVRLAISSVSSWSTRPKPRNSRSSPS